MANNTDSNITRRLIRAFIPAFEKQRVVSKTIDTQTFQGKFTPSAGTVVDIKRPHQYKSKRTSDGDITGLTKNDIVSGKASATVQNYITVDIGWSNLEEATSLDQLEKILMPAAEEAVTELETSFCNFLIENLGLAVGTPGTDIDAWTDIASQGSMLKSLGVMGTVYSVHNPWTIQGLASAQSGLYGGDSLIKTAWEKAQVSSPTFAGVQVLASNSLSTWTTAVAADRAGALTGAPTATYAAAKDTMTQVLAVTGFTANATLKAGDILEFPGTGALARSYIHPKTRKTIFKAGSPIPWRCTVTEDVTLNGSGAGNVTVTGPAIYESGGQYDNISAALTTSDVVNVLGSSGVEYQPSLFYVREAASIAFVKLPKLYSTDTIGTTSDGVSIRVSKYSDGDANTQKVRFDILPAFGIMNPFFGGKGFGFS
jgi:hypothetical protein